MRAMRFAVDDEGAGAADAFTAVVIERDGFLSLGGEVFVHDIQHFEERHVGVEFRGLVGFETAGIRGVLLSPDFESDFHGL